MTRNFFLMLLFPFIYTLSTQLPEASATTSSIIQVVMNQADSIKGRHEDKLYLKAENIFHSQYGHVLHDGRSAIVLPRLSFDENGEGYLLCRSADDFQLACSNPDCGKVWWFSDTWSIYCPKCGTMGN